jgi:uncharacterized membrane protein YfcA
VAAGHVNVLLVAALLLGSSFGVRAGVWHRHRLPVLQLQRAFAVLILVVAVIVVVNIVVSNHE